MPYVGRSTDKISNVEVLDNITFDGSSSYTLQKNSVNFTPSSANTLLVSIDGVVQAGNFTVSGSTIDFGTAVAGTSTCDFILHYGIGLITTPSDGSVTTAKLGDSAVTTAKLNDASVSLVKLTATGTKDATTFLRGDNTFAVPASETNTPAFLATMTTDQTIAHSTNVKMQFSSEVFDTDSCYDNVTNYRFTPTVAGKYYVTLYIYVNSQASGNLRIMIPKLYKNNVQEIISAGDFATGYQNNATYGVSGLVEMNGTTDYLEGYIYHYTQDGTTSIAGNSNSKFSAFKIIE
jgi:hypothetical protein